MLGEQVEHNGKLVAVEDIVLPDVEMVGLYLRCMGDTVRLEYVHRTTQRLLERILNRDPSNYTKFHLDIDVPLLALLGTHSLPKEESQMVKELWELLHSLARHLFPNTKTSDYGNGSRYSGYCWFTEEDYVFD